MDRLIGKTISHYKILEKLGAGGMGVVYKAQDTMLERLVAIKFLPPYLDSDEKQTQRFLQEAKAASSLDHPNICTIHEINTTGDGNMFIVMAYYEGETLKEKLASGKVYPEPVEGWQVENSIDVGIQLAEGLMAAHRKGIVHRDIKPANIVITGDGIAKILDFGLAKVSGQQLTKSNTTLGTLAYSPPEQLRGQEVDQRADIWSTGVVLYQMLTGKRPFTGETEEALFFSILNDDPNPIITEDDNGDALSAIINKTLQKRPENRYQQTEALLNDLKSIQSGTGDSTATTQEICCPPNQQDKRPLIWAGVLTILAIFTFLFWITKDNLFHKTPSQNARRIAVLPFDNISPDSQNEYFADGMTEEMISRLSQISGLDVIARSSVMQYKNVQRDIKEIGKKLKVGSLLTGSIRKNDVQMRISVQLITVEDQTNLWSQDYSREFESVFAVQQDIAEQVAEALQIELLAGEQLQLAKSLTENTEAHQLYLKGRFAMYEFDEEGLNKAKSYFQQAIALDSSFALAYSGLSDSYYFLSNAYLPPDVAMPNARNAAQTAINLDSSLAEAYASLATFYAFYDWNWPKAERLFKKAISLNSNYANAYHYYGIMLCYFGRFKEAEAMFNKALLLDPLSLSIELTSIWPDLFQGKIETGLEKTHKIIEREPNFFPAYAMLGWLYERAGNYDLSIASFERYKEVSDYPWTVSFLGYIYARAGMIDKANAILDTLFTLEGQGVHISPSTIASIYVALSNRDEAFNWLERAYIEKDEELGRVNINWLFDDIRSDPRFTDLIKRMNF